MEVVNIILVAIFFISWNEVDYIDHQPKYSFFPNWKWYVENRWQTKSWWLKNVFTVFLDGGHFHRTMFRLIGFFFFSQLVVSGCFVYLLTISLYFLTGSVHSIINKTIHKGNI